MSPDFNSAKTKCSFSEKKKVGQVNHSNDVLKLVIVMSQNLANNK